MAEVGITIKVSEAEQSNWEAILCEGEELPVTPGNTKAAIIAILKRRRLALERAKKRAEAVAAEEALQPPGGIS